jgi:hypothetical protein
MNTWTHLLASGGLALMALIIHAAIRNDQNTSALDVARYYTMTRERGDVNLAKQALGNDDAWLRTECRTNVSKPIATTDACVLERRALRNKILGAMNCFAYSSQMCSYLRTVTAGIVQNKTIGGTELTIGRSLTGIVPGTSINYRQLLYNAVEKAPLLFHNSYRAAQKDDFYVLHTILYTLVAFAIFGNILVHYFDTYAMSWSNRLIMRILVLGLSTLFVSFMFLINAGGAAFTVIAGIWLPAVIVLIYYEAFLDASITRPWCVLCLVCSPFLPPPLADP